MNLTSEEKLSQINLGWLIEAYQNTNNKNEFFNNFFPKLAGTQKLQQQIESGMSERAIKATWQAGLANFQNTRKKYLLYR